MLRLRTPQTAAQWEVESRWSNGRDTIIRSSDKAAVRKLLIHHHWTRRASIGHDTACVQLHAFEDEPPLIICVDDIMTSQQVPAVTLAASRWIRLRHPQFSIYMACKWAVRRLHGGIPFRFWLPREGGNTCAAGTGWTLGSSHELFFSAVYCTHWHYIGSDTNDETRVLVDGRSI